MPKIANANPINNAPTSTPAIKPPITPLPGFQNFHHGVFT